MSYRLITLGGVALARDGRALNGSTTQRRRLALLALIAAARDRGVSRDRLVGMLWPESDEPKARQALAQWLHLIRRDLGDDELFLGTSDLRLNPERITSDVSELDAALDRHDLERAAGLYGGPFLDGFHVGGAPEFERWADEQRTRLASRMRDSFQSLSRAAASRGDGERSAHWAERFAALDPLDAKAALFYMNALAAAGERERAIRHARLHAELVRAQLDIDPDPAIEALADRLRTSPAAAHAPTIPSSSIGAVRTHDAAVAGATPAAHEESASAGRPADAAATKGLRAGRRSRVTSVVALSVVLALATIAVSMRVGSGGVDDDLVIVYPFRVTSADPETHFLREGMLDLLAASFTGEGGPRAHDARAVLADWRRITSDSVEPSEGVLLRAARARGAANVVIGSVVGQKEQLIFNARLVDSRTGEARAIATERGPLDSMPVLVDRIAAALLVELSGVSRRLPLSLAGAPLAALRAYLEGQTAHRAARYGEARLRHEQALAIDSTFVPAAFGLATAAQWVQDLPTLSRAVRQAGASGQRLDERGRALLAAWNAVHSASSRISAWQRVIELCPDNPDAWYEFGDALFHDGAAIGASQPLARARAALDRAIALDSAFLPAMEHMVDLAALEANTENASRWARRLLAVDSLADNADYARWRAATAESDEAALTVLRAGFESMSQATLSRIIGTAQLAAVGLDDARRAGDVLLRRATTAGQRGQAIGRLAMLALNRGQIDELNALRTSRHAPHVDLFGPLYFGADSAHVSTSLASYGDFLNRHDPVDTVAGMNRYAMTCFIALYHVVAGDRVSVREWVGKLAALTPMARKIGAAERISGRGAYCQGTIDAWNAVAANAPEARRIVDDFDAWAALGPYERPALVVPFLLATMWERLGEPRRALAAVQRRSNNWHNGETFLAATLRKEGELAARLGEHEIAIAAYRKYLALRAGADARLQPELDQIRGELRRLEGNAPRASGGE